MRTAAKVVAPITDEERLRLNPNWRTRMRAQAILLSEKGFAINQLATIFEIDRDSVGWWADYKFDGLADDPRSGRQPILADEVKKTKR